MKYSTVVLAAWLLALAAPAMAAEGRIPVSVPGTVISTPGHYYVTRDLDGGGATVIGITADGVTLDLNGFTLSDSAADILTIGGTAGASRGVTVRNGRLSGGFAAIYSASGTPRRLHFEELSIDGTGERGILVEAAAFVSVRSCEISNTAQTGLEILGGSAAFGGEIVRNRISGSQTGGIFLNGLEAGEVRDNLVVNCGLAGGASSAIYLTANNAWGAGGNLIADNTVSGFSGTQYGIYIGPELDENLVRGNVVRGAAGLAGLLVDSASSLIAGNVLAGNSGVGIILGGIYPLLELNQIGGNGDYGIKCTGLQTGAYRNNMLRGNTPTAVSGDTCEFTTDAGGNIP